VASPNGDTPKHFPNLLSGLVKDTHGDSLQEQAWQTASLMFIAPRCQSQQAYPRAVKESSHYFC